MTTDAKRKFLIDIFYFLVIAFIIYLVCRFLLSFLFPFVIGIGLAFFMQKPGKVLSEKFKLPKSGATVFLVVVTYILVIALLFLVCFLLYKWIYALSQDLPKILPMLTEGFSAISGKFDSLLGGIPKNLLSTALNTITELFSSAAADAATALPSFLIATVVTVVASCYIAKDFDRIIIFARGCSSTKIWGIINDIKEIFVTTLFKMIRGYLFLMLITFLELTLGLWLIGVNNFLGLAAIISIVDVLPVLGTGTVVIPWAVMELITGDVLKAVALLIMYIAITVIRNILEPKIIGEQIGLSPLLALIAIFLGLKLMGIAGMFIFPLILICIFTLYKKGKLPIE